MPETKPPGLDNLLGPLLLLLFAGGGTNFEGHMGNILNLLKSSKAAMESIRTGVETLNSGFNTFSLYNTKLYQNNKTKEPIEQSPQLKEPKPEESNNELLAPDPENSQSEAPNP